MLYTHISAQSLPTSILVKSSPQPRHHAPAISTVHHHSRHSLQHNMAYHHMACHNNNNMHSYNHRLRSDHHVHSTRRIVHQVRTRAWEEEEQSSAVDDAIASHGRVYVCMSPRCCIGLHVQARIDQHSVLWAHHNNIYIHKHHSCDHRRHNRMMHHSCRHWMISRICL